MKKYSISDTSKYDLFINNDEQREHKDKHIQEIKASMMKWGFIPSQPVAVIPKGARLLIIDGHSRFDAAQQLGIPVFYIVLDKRFAEAVAILNVQKEWGAADHARRYAIKGDPDYVGLMKYVMEGIPLTVAASMLYGQSAGSGNATSKVKSGEFEIRDTRQIDAVTELIREVGDICPAVKTRHFIEAVSMCYFVPEFEMQRLKSKLTTFTRQFSKTVTRQAMLDQIDELYNYKSAIKIPLAFKAKEVAKCRNAVKSAK